MDFNSAALDDPEVLEDLETLIVSEDASIIAAVLRGEVDIAMGRVTWETVFWLGPCAMCGYEPLFVMAGCGDE